MTQKLEKAWDKIKDLPEDKQDLIARMILEEIEDEEHWDKQFSETADKMPELAEKVRKDVKEGKVKKKGFGGM